MTKNPPFFGFQLYKKGKAVPNKFIVITNKRRFVPGMYFRNMSVIDGKEKGRIKCTKIIKEDRRESAVRLLVRAGYEKPLCKKLKGKNMFRIELRPDFPIQAGELVKTTKGKLRIRTILKTMTNKYGDFFLIVKGSIK